MKRLKVPQGSRSPKPFRRIHSRLHGLITIRIDPNCPEREITPEGTVRRIVRCHKHVEEKAGGEDAVELLFNVPKPFFFCLMIYDLKSF